MLLFCARSAPAYVLLVLALILSACTTGGDASGGEDPPPPVSGGEERPTHTSGGEASSPPVSNGPELGTGSGWVLHNYRSVGDGEELVAVGTARLSIDGAVTAMDLEVSEGPHQGRVVVNETGTYLGTQALGRSVSSDGHQWIRLDGAAAAHTPESLVLSVEDETIPLREVPTSSGSLTVLPASGSLQIGPDGSYVARVGEVWVDDGGDPRRRVTHTFVRTADGQELRYWGYADRDDTVEVVPANPIPDHAMPMAAAVRGVQAVGGPVETASPTSGKAQSETTIGRVIQVQANGTQPEDTCIVTYVLDPDRAIFSGVHIDCPPGVEAPQVLDGPALDDPSELSSPELDEALRRLRDARRDARIAAEEGCYTFIIGTLIALSIGSLSIPPVGAAFAAANMSLVIHFVLLAALLATAGAVIYCQVFYGDPHIRTADGLSFEFQGVGEFVTTRSDLVTVQQRFEGDKGRFTAVSATAIAAGGDVVEIRWSPEGPQVIVNGAPVDAEPNGRGLPEGGTVLWAGDDEDVGVVTPDGSWVWVAHGRNSQDVSTSLTQTAAADADGLGGTPDGDPTNDFSLRNGSVIALAGSRSLDVLYGEVGNDWRVRPDERLFTDGRAEDWLTDAIVAVPTSVASLADFTSEQLQGARDACLEAGVPRGERLDGCAFDVLVSGDDGWADQAGASSPSARMGTEVERVGDHPLHIASHRCELTEVQTLLDGGDDPNIARPEDGMTPLHFAAQEGCADVVDQLVAAGARPDVRTDSLVTPLSLAAQNGHDDALQRLLSAGADPAPVDEDGGTPILAASYRGHDDVVASLLSRGVPVDVARADDGFTALLAAVQEHELEVAQLLLNHGADPEKPDRRGRTSLLAAAVNDDEAMVTLLLAAGAAGDRARAEDEATALHLAASYGAAAAARALLAGGADVNAVMEGDRTPLHIAAAEDEAAVARVLLAAGADPQVRDAHGRTPRELTEPGDQVRAILP